MKTTIEAPVYVLEYILRTLEIWGDLHECHKLNSCLDRDTMHGILMINKLLSGEELTGKERCEIYSKYNHRSLDTGEHLSVKERELSELLCNVLETISCAVTNAEVITTEHGKTYCMNFRYVPTLEFTEDEMGLIKNLSALTGRDFSTITDN